jgi:L-ascorbate metabolism protein UlaG (beta-lactamase superfamily)
MRNELSAEDEARLKQEAEDNSKKTRDANRRAIMMTNAWHIRVADAARELLHAMDGGYLYRWDELTYPMQLEYLHQLLSVEIAFMNAAEARKADAMVVSIAEPTVILDPAVLVAPAAIGLSLDDVEG